MLILFSKSEGETLPRCSDNAYPLEVYCGKMFYGPLVIVFQSIKYPHRLRDFVPEFLTQKIEPVVNRDNPKMIFTYQQPT